MWVSPPACCQVREGHPPHSPVSQASSAAEWPERAVACTSPSPGGVGALLGLGGGAGAPPLPLCVLVGVMVEGAWIAPANLKRCGERCQNGCWTALVVSE